LFINGFISLSDLLIVYLRSLAIDEFILSGASLSLLLPLNSDNN
jgi:hypothetical protein